MHATATVRHDRLLEAQETLANEKVVPASQPASLLGLGGFIRVRYARKLQSAELLTNVNVTRAGQLARSSADYSLINQKCLASGVHRTDFTKLVQ